MNFDLLNAVGWLESSNGIVSLPDIAGYVLGCRPDRPQAVAKLRRIRGASPDVFPVLMGYNSFALEAYLGNIPTAEKRLTEQYWPGPLVIGLKRQQLNLKYSALEQSFAGELLGVTQPENPILTDLLSLLPDGVLITTDACRGGTTQARTSLEVYNTFGDDVDFILTDDASVQNSLPATIVTLDERGNPLVLRSGCLVLE